MTKDEFIKRKELVDLVTAYHVIPGGWGPRRADANAGVLIIALVRLSARVLWFCSSQGSRP
jgi:hypothetical protein